MQDLPDGVGRDLAGLPLASTKPRASAPSATARSASSSLVTPQIFTHGWHDATPWTPPRVPWPATGGDTPPDEGGPNGRPGCTALHWLPYAACRVAYAVLNQIGAPGAAAARAAAARLRRGRVRRHGAHRRLQRPLGPRRPALVGYLAAWLVYLSHFVVTVAWRWLWFGDHRRFRRWRRLVLSYQLRRLRHLRRLPCASRRGAEHPWRHAPHRPDRARVWDHLGAHRIAAIFGQNSKLAFEVGAPSLHAAAPSWPQ